MLHFTTTKERTATFGGSTKAVYISQVGHEQDNPQARRQEEVKYEEADPTIQTICQKCHIVVPYVQGICDSFKSICGKHGVTVPFKEVQSLKDISVSPKDKDTMTKKNSVIYWYRCDKIACDEEYIGESSQMFGDGYREHLKAPSPIFDHKNNSGHITTVENFRIIGREGNFMVRDIK